MSRCIYFVYIKDYDANKTNFKGPNQPVVHSHELVVQFQVWLKHPVLKALPLEDVTFHPKQYLPVFDKQH